MYIYVCIYIYVYIYGDVNGSLHYYGSTFKYTNQVKKGSNDPLVIYAKKLLEAGFIHSELYMTKKWGVRNTWRNDCKSIEAMNNKNFSGIYIYIYIHIYIYVYINEYIYMYIYIYIYI
jgi:hypothetical protein